MRTTTPVTTMTTAMFTASIATILHMLKRAGAGITIIMTMT